LLFKFALEYSIGWVEAKWKGVKLNFIHQVLVHADDVFLTVKVFILYRKTEKLHTQ